MGTQPKLISSCFIGVCNRILSYCNQNDIICSKYVPITSVEIKKSFSAYKTFLSDN